MPISRKHFDLIAKIFSIAKEYVQSEGELSRLFILADATACALEATSQTFKKDRFLSACGFDVKPRC